LTTSRVDHLPGWPPSCWFAWTLNQLKGARTNGEDTVSTIRWMTLHGRKVKGWGHQIREWSVLEVLWEWISSSVNVWEECLEMRLAAQYLNIAKLDNELSWLSWLRAGWSSHIMSFTWTLRPELPPSKREASHPFFYGRPTSILMF